MKGTKGTKSRGGEPKPYGELHRRALEHIGRNVITIIPVLERAVFHGNAKQCDNILTRLRDNGWAVPRGRANGRSPGQIALSGNRSYYQLTPETAADLGFPARRAKPLSPSSFEEYLALLWFSQMGTPNYERLQPQSLKCFNPPLPEEGYHYYMKLSEGQRLYSLHYHAAKSATSYRLRKLREEIASAREHPDLRLLIAARRFGIILLVNTDGKAAEWEGLLGTKEFHASGVPEILVRMAPSSVTLALALEKLRAQTGSV